MIYAFSNLYKDGAPLNFYVGLAKSISEGSEINSAFVRSGQLGFLSCPCIFTPDCAHIEPIEEERVTTVSMPQKEKKEEDSGEETIGPEQQQKR